jgi:hypothetical protein
MWAASRPDVLYYIIFINQHHKYICLFNFVNYYNEITTKIICNKILCGGAIL